MPIPAKPAAAILAFGATVGIASTLMVSLAPKPRPAWLPDPVACPGVVLPGISREDTCDPGYAKRVRHVTEAMKLAVFRRDGIDPTPENRRLREVDHRVPLSIGGANTLGNLWAENWDGPFNAHMKDRAEFRAYKLVCQGVLTIEQAQAIFQGDWSQFYVEQFGNPAHPMMRATSGEEPEEEGDAEGFPINPPPPSP